MDAKKKLIILGASDQAKVITYSISEEYTICGFIDIYNNPNFQMKDYNGLPLLGDLHTMDTIIKKETYSSIVAIGDNDYRKTIFNQYQADAKIINVIHPNVIYQENLVMGSGNYIGPGTIINNDVNIGNNCIINTGTIIEHDCVINDHVSLAPGTILSGHVTVGTGAFIGAGATVIDDIKIGAGAIIGAGATVLKDVPEKTLAVGTPAQIIKKL